MIRLPIFFRREPALEGGPVPLRHLYGIVTAEEIRGVQQMDVERVALHPLAAIEQAAQSCDGRVHHHPERILDRGAGAHLVGHRADPADTRREVRRLGRPPAAQERLEVAGRLENPQLHVLDPAVAHRHPERPLALDPRQPLDRNRAQAFRRCHGPSFSTRPGFRPRSVTA